MKRAALLAILLAGCAGRMPTPDDVRALRTELNKQREDVAAADGETRGLMVSLQLACARQKSIPAIKPLCRRVVPLGLTIDSAIVASKLAIDTADAGLGTVEQAQTAVAALRRLIGDLKALVSEVDHAGDVVEQGSGSAGPDLGGQPGTETAAPAEGQGGLGEGAPGAVPAGDRAGEGAP